MPKLYIEVYGGCVQRVYSNSATEVVLVDHDNHYPENVEIDTKLLNEFEADKNSSEFTELEIK